MVKSIVISGVTRTGKTMVAIALARKIQSTGKSVGYFKPVGTKSYRHHEIAEDVDEDALLMKELLHMEEPLSTICPIVRTRAKYDEFLERGHSALKGLVNRSFHQIAEKYDIVLVEGTEAPWHLLHVGLSTPEIAKELDSEVVSLVNFPDVSAIDDVLLQRNLFNGIERKPIGTVLMQVPPMLRSVVTEEITSFLEHHDVRVIGVVYYSRELFSPTIREIRDALDAEIVSGHDNIDLPIGHFMVGSMAPENALKWFRRAKDKAVITSGDRTDICLAALATETRLLILTGGLGPDRATLTRAQEEGIAVIVTDKDTYTTSQLVNNLVGTVSVDNPGKLSIIEHVVGDALDFDKLNLF
ncbi:MAG: DRTGG domain-containing protein [Candidatus Thorarchaeota archaeon]|nr:MAG: hypothetical protein DRO87_06685 [Candidatus Thorarchaeota archaeon]RLI57852.1 MAG: hypothetical protein DRP09_02080 [Candidatus Thorarchaeota archaeon]